jgi:homoserine kinase
MMPITLRLPATSANLGPGFDALGLAMQLYLEVEAREAGDFSIEATGRDAGLVGSLERNLMVETYRALATAGPALALKIRNGIPLGMGCGSSAAALVAGVMLANHFGRLGMTADEVVDEASRREGHPDNVAACFYGGLTVSSMAMEPTLAARGWGTAGEGGGGEGMAMEPTLAARGWGTRRMRVTAATFGAELGWRLLLALPGEGLATTKARAMLPESYSRGDAVENIQATALLVAAFALGRPELLGAGTRDRIHQPYRSAACPLLPLLGPLAGREGIYSVTLSGAGPSVLLICDAEQPASAQVAAIQAAAGDVDVVETRMAGDGADVLYTKVIC